MIVLVSRNTQISHADLTSLLNPFSPSMKLLDTITETTGTQLPVNAMLNAEVTRQAAAIAYLNDFRLLMYIDLAAIPLLLFMRVPKRAKVSPEQAAMAME
jgi:DHA2 family multidrug resistance protein